MRVERSLRPELEVTACSPASFGQFGSIGDGWAVGRVVRRAATRYLVKEIDGIALV